MITVDSLHIYPLKSGQPVTLQAAEITNAGLAWDRNWMVVDEAGCFVTQRQQPKMATVAVTIRGNTVLLDAPRMPSLSIPLAARALVPRRVRVWNDAFDAFDEGDQAADWFFGVLQMRCRLVRFNPLHHRVSEPRWTGPDVGLNRFSDGFPILILGAASVDDLNARLAAPLPANRFRPNIVIAGLAPYDEDHLNALRAGSITLRIVKPCTRCEITTTDQRTGARGAEPLRTLSRYRSNERMQGGVTFGQNAIVTSGAGDTLAVGMSLEPDWAF